MKLREWNSSIHGGHLSIFIISSLNNLTPAMGIRTLTTSERTP